MWVPGDRSLEPDRTEVQGHTGIPAYRHTCIPAYLLAYLQPIVILFHRVSCSMGHRQSDTDKSFARGCRKQEVPSWKHFSEKGEKVREGQG